MFFKSKVGKLITLKDDINNQKYGIIIDRKWCWFSFKSYHIYDYENDIYIGLRFGLNRWGWKYLILVDGELNWCWSDFFYIKN